MKKFLSIILAIIMMLSTVNCVLASGSLVGGGAARPNGGGTSVAPKQKLSGSMSDGDFVKHEFYVRNEEDTVFWGGGFSVNEKLSEEVYALFIALYDNDRLLLAELVSIDESLASYRFEERGITVANVPENLSAKAFAWSADGKMTPLSNTVYAEENSHTYYALGRITEVLDSDTLEFQIEYSENFEGENIDETNPIHIRAIYTDEEITEHIAEYMNIAVSVNKTGEYQIVKHEVNTVARFSLLRSAFTFEVQDNNIRLINEDGNLKISGNAEINTDLENYEIKLAVLDNGETLYSDTLKLDSKIKEFKIDEELDIEESGSLLLNIDFLYEGESLTDTVSRLVITDECEVSGRVTKVYRGTEAEFLNNVYFMIEEAESFEGEAVTSDNAKEILVDAMNTDITCLTGAKITLNIVYKDEKYRAVSYKAWDGNEIVTKQSDSLVSYKNNVLKFSDGEYELEEGFKLYVNGTLVSKNSTSASMARYLENNSETKVKLLNTPTAKTGYVDDKYDYVLLSVYTSAVVDLVMIEETEATVYLKSFDTIILEDSYIDIDLEAVSNGEQSYSITDTDGNDVLLEELKEGDVITIYADFASNYPLDCPDWIDIVVSHKRVNGQVINERPETRQYKIEDTWYSFAHSRDTLEVGEEYFLYLDMFGKIVSYEINVQNINYGIINRVGINDKGNNIVTLKNKYGDLVQYEFLNDREYNELINWRNTYFNSDLNTALQNGAVITYKLTKQNKIYGIKSVAMKFKTAMFSKDDLRLGSVTMSEYTKILDCTMLTSISVNMENIVSPVSLEMLNDEEEYTVAYGGTRFSDGTYPFVIILSGVIGGVGETASVAVVKSAGVSVNEVDGIIYYTVNCIKEGVDETLYFEDVNEELNSGDVVVYSLNSDGLVDEYYKLFGASDGIELINYSRKTLGDMPPAWYGGNVEIGYGVLTKKTDGSIMIGEVEAVNGNYETAVINELPLSIDTNVYICDYSKPQASRITSGTVDNLWNTKIHDSFYSDGIYRWTEAEKIEANMVFYKSRNGLVTDVVLMCNTDRINKDFCTGEGEIEDISTVDGNILIRFINTSGDLDSIQEIYFDASECTITDAAGNEMTIEDLKNGHILELSKDGWGDNVITVSGMAG